MRTILKIAWRNIWRHRLRSLVVIGSILIGIWAGVYVSGFSYGLNEQRTQSVIEERLSHIQIHHPQWKEEAKLEYEIGQPEKLQDYLAKSLEVKHSAPRIILNGMLGSAHYTTGIRIQGVEPHAEDQLTGLQERVDSGQYFSSKTRNSILIGDALAEKLEVKPGSKVVLTFTDEQGTILSGAFKVDGIYSDLSPQIEKSLVYVQNKDLVNILDRDELVHEFAIYLKDPEQLETFKSELQSAFPELRVESWKELSPELGYANELMSTMLYVIIGIIMLALCFGIINTMMMAVLERRKELGMLMGVGMSKTRLFLMIIFETLMLSLIGGPLGILLGYLSIKLSQQTGLDLSSFGEGLGEYGIESVIYPSLMPAFYFGTGALVMGITLIAAIWPARRALKLNPVEAIRTI